MPIIIASLVELGEEYGLGGGWDEKGPYQNRPYMVDWADKFPLMQLLAGGTSYSGPFGSGEWTRTLPFQDPEIPTLYVDSVTWRPEGRMLTTAPISYASAVVTATFRRPEFNYQQSDDIMNVSSIDPTVPPLPYCSWELDYGSEWRDIPKSSGKYLSDSTQIPFPISRRLCVVGMTLTFHKYPISPLPLLRDYADTLNSTTFLGCDPETLMLLGGTRSWGGNEDGALTQDVIMKFKWRKISWNKFPRPDGYTFDYVVDKITGNKVYATADYSPLLLSVLS